MKLIPHADDFFSQKDAEFFYQREFRRVYAHAALVLAVWDEYTQLADTREFTMRLLRALRLCVRPKTLREREKQCDLSEFC